MSGCLVILENLRVFNKTISFLAKIDNKNHACGCLAKVIFVNLAGVLYIKVHIAISYLEGLFFEVAKGSK